MTLFGRDPFGDDFFGGGGGRGGGRDQGSGSLIESMMGGGMFGGFGRMGNMMQEFDTAMSRHMQQARGAVESATRGDGPPGAVVRSSSFSYSSMQGPGGPPVVVQKSESFSRGPNGAIEKKAALKDSRAGIDKLRVHREYNGRARTIERMRDASGHEESHDTLHNMDEREASDFDREWANAHGYPGVHSRLESNFGGLGGHGGGGRLLDSSRSRNEPPALEHRPSASSLAGSTFRRDRSVPPSTRSDRFADTHRSDRSGAGGLGSTARSGLGGTGTARSAGLGNTERSGYSSRFSDSSRMSEHSSRGPGSVASRAPSSRRDY